MIKYIQAFLFFSLILLIINCCRTSRINNSLSIIDIEANIKNMQKVNLSQFTNIIHYIPLKTLEDLSLSHVVSCDFSDSLILVNDLRKCLLYDFEGNFISKIGNQGRGPGEYQYVTNISFGPDNRVYIQSLFDLFEYHINGSFLNKYEKRFLPDNDYIGSWLLIEDSLFFGKVSSSTGLERNKALIFNKQGGIKYFFRNYILFNRGRELAGRMEQHANIYYFQNRCFFKEAFNDTLFYLNKDFHLIPLYVFKLGKFSEPVSHRENKVQKKDLGITKEWQNYIYLEDVFHTSNHLLLNCRFNSQFPAKRLTPKTIVEGMTSMYNNTNVLGLFDIKAEKLIFAEPTSTNNPLFTSGLYNDIDAGPRFIPQKQVNDSVMVMWVQASELKNHVSSDDFKNNMPKYPEKKKELEKLAASLKETDNPVLVLVRLKE